MRITIKEIAERLNVHHSTVSRALHNDVRVKAETGEMIRKYAKENGYYVNQNALRLRGGLRNTLAVIVPEINHRFFSNIINYLTDLAYENNCVIFIYQTNNDYQQECSIIEKVIQMDVAGVLASVSGTTTSGVYYNRLKNLGIPLVFFDRILPDVDTSCVTTNNAEIVGTLIKELVAMGNDRIAQINGSETISVFHERSKGYSNAMDGCQTCYRKQITIKGALTVKAGRKAASELFRAKAHPSAIISSSFFLTMGIVSFLIDKGYRIPKEVAVVGFGDRLFNEMLHPAIISVEQPEKEIAETAFNLLMRCIEKGGGADESNVKKIQLESTIVYPNKKSKYHQYVKRNFTPD